MADSDVDGGAPVLERMVEYIIPDLRRWAHKYEIDTCKISLSRGIPVTLEAKKSRWSSGLLLASSSIRCKCLRIG